MTSPATAATPGRSRAAAAATTTGTAETAAAATAAGTTETATTSAAAGSAKSAATGVAARLVKILRPCLSAVAHLLLAVEVLLNRRVVVQRPPLVGLALLPLIGRLIPLVYIPAAIGEDIVAASGVTAGSSALGANGS